MKTAARNLLIVVVVFAVYFGPDAYVYYQIAEGKEHLSEGRFAEAESLLRKAVDNYRRHPLPSKRNHQRLGPALSWHARSLQDLGRYAEAEALYREVVALYRAALPIGHRDIAASLSNLASLLIEIGRYDEAAALHREAVATILSAPPEDPETAGYLINLALALANYGQFTEAEPFWRESVGVLRKATAEHHREIIGKLNNFGNSLIKSGRYGEAEAVFRVALWIGRNGTSGNPLDTARMLGQVATLCQATGRYDEAERLHREALDIYRALLPDGDREFADGLLQLGDALYFAGRGDEAESLYREALAIARAVQPEDGVLTALSLSSLAGRLADTGRHEEAEPLYREILSSEHPSIGVGGLADLLTQTGRYSEAEPLHIKSLSNAQINQIPGNILVAAARLSKHYAVQGQPALAIFFGKQAVNTIQSIRKHLTKGATQGKLPVQQSFLRSHIDRYIDLADLLISQGRHAEAQQVLDMLKEQELYDYIQEEGAHDPRETRVEFNAMEIDWTQTYDAAAEPARALAKRLSALTRTPAEKRTETEQAEITRLTAERDALSAELQRQLAALPEHFAAIDPARQAAEDQRFAEAADTKRALLAALSEQSDQPTGLLQFILLEDKVRLLLTTPEGWYTAVVAVDGDTLNTEIDALRIALTNRWSDATTPAKALYTRLVDPITEAIDAAGIESLLVHLDGKLRYIPFAALHDGEQWLAERWSLVYYTAASERQPEAAGGGGGDWRVAGLGVSEKRGNFKPLPAVTDEIDGIVREGDADPNGVLPGRALLNAAFSESALRSEATNTDNGILHIASHFSLRPGSDADSSLLLGTLGADGAPDTLSLKALRESDPPLDLRHLDLVALSACNTFMGGADESGVEIEGMGAIIQRQGARGVLASLWPVADASTGVLMQTFYGLRAERPDLTKAQALQAAQLALLHRDPATGTCASDRSPLVVSGGTQAPAAPADPSACRWSHPYYWAPFVLMGNWL